MTWTADGRRARELRQHATRKATAAAYRRNTIPAAWQHTLGLLAGTLLALACQAPAALPQTTAPAAPAAPSAPASGAPAASQPSAASPPAAAPAPATVRVGLMLSASDAGFFVALEQGYFTEQGINLEVEPIQAAATMLAPLAAGQIEIGGTTLTPGFLNAIARDVSIKVVADKGTTAPGFGYEGLMVRKALVDSGTFQGPGDLGGRKVAIPSVASGAQAALERALARGGISSRDVDINTLAFADMEAAFAGDAIDAAMVIEPFLTRILDRGVGALYARDDEYYPNHQLGVAMYAQTFVLEQPDVARRAMVAYLKGVRDYNDAFVKRDPAKRAAAVAALVKHTTVKDPALYDRMAMPGLNPNGTVNLDSLAADQEYFLSTGHQQQRVEMNVLVDGSFADAAAQALGPYR
jgi:NitT/TauT family transport system substrate-binding protein